MIKYVGVVDIWAPGNSGPVADATSNSYEITLPGPRDEDAAKDAILRLWREGGSVANGRAGLSDNPDNHHEPRLVDIEDVPSP